MDRPLLRGAQPLYAMTARFWTCLLFGLALVVLIFFAFFGNIRIPGG
jgi:hypothetical protein